MVEATSQELNPCPTGRKRTLDGDPIGPDGPAGEDRCSRLGDHLAGTTGKRLRRAIKLAASHHGDELASHRVTPRPAPDRSRSPTTLAPARRIKRIFGRKGQAAIDEVKGGTPAITITKANCRLPHACLVEEGD